ACFIKVDSFSNIYPYSDKYDNCFNQKDTLSDPIFRFAIIADIQYGDKETAKGRYYRTSLERLLKCVDDLNRRKLSMVVQMGDIIDGHRDDIKKTHEDLRSILNVLNSLNFPIYHVVGNHDLVAEQKYLFNSLGLKESFYDFTNDDLPGWRMIVLDGNDGGYGIMTPHQIKWLDEVLKQAQINGE